MFSLALIMGLLSSSPIPHVGDDSLYPNPALTSGEVLSVTDSDVCLRGYAGRTRHVTESEKKQVFIRYRIPYSQHRDYEIDHFISLELGGSNGLTNLWPEPYLPRPGAHEKDMVEDYLHTQVCHQRMTLKEAQDAIRSDWYKIYVELKGGIHQ